MIISAAVENLTSWEKKLLYMCNARPTINTRALYSDVTEDYRSPAEPMPGDTVKIRLRTGRYNVDKAYIYVNNVECPMTKIKAVGLFDYYEASVKVGEEKLYYYFKVETGKVVCYYNQIGAINGQRVQLCTRYLQTDFVTVISRTMCLIMSTAISENTSVR